MLENLVHNEKVVTEITRMRSKHGKYCFSLCGFKCPFGLLSKQNTFFNNYYYWTKDLNVEMLVNQGFKWHNVPTKLCFNYIFLISRG